MRISDWSSDVCSSDLHAVAEHVAGHVADADAGEILGLAVAAHRAEMALDRFPRTARGDAHALVVVADGTAGGERVVEPVTVGLGDAVGDIGEAGDRKSVV